MWFKPHRCRHQFLEQPDIVVDDMILQVTAKQKYLGFIFDNQLTWSGHVSNICKKMSYYLHLIGLHKCVLSVCLINYVAINGLFSLSHVQYALPVWSPFMYQHHVQRLQRLQNCAVCMIFTLTM